MVYVFVELLNWLVAFCCCVFRNGFKCKLSSASKQHALFFTALLLFVQNNLEFVVLLYLSAATFQLLMSLKIVALAMISRLFGNKTKLHAMQHSIIFVQCVGAMQHFLSLSNEALAIPLMPCLSMLCVVVSSALTNLYTLEPDTQTTLHHLFLYAYGMTFNALNWSRSILMGDAPIGDFSWHVVVLIVVASLHALCISIVLRELGTLANNAIRIFAIVVAAVCEYELFQSRISLLMFTTFIVMILCSFAYPYASGHATHGD